MLRALYTSSNALIDQQTGVDTISNNIANINTVGYKKSRTTFADIISQTINGGIAGQNPMQVGLGSRMSSTDTIFNQGELVQTDHPTDVALNGDGFFSLYDPESNDVGLFTRAGNFSFDANSNLVTPDGYKVAGWLAQVSSAGSSFEIPEDASGMPTGEIQPINISDYSTVPAVSSTYIKFKANLNGGNSVKEYSPADNTKDFSIMLNSNGESLGVNDGDNFQISYDNGNSWHTYEYDSDGSVSPTAESFTTLQNLLDNINNDLQSDANNASASLDGGRIKINNNDGSDLIVKVRPTSDDTSFSGTPKENQKLTTVMSNLNQVIAPSSSVTTQDMNIATHIVQSFFYDSEGEKHKINVTFKKSGVNQWSYDVSLPDNEGTLTNNTGTINFDGNGGLSKTTTSPTVDVALYSGAAPTQLLINLWNTDSAGYDGNQYSGLTQFALDADTSFQTQDGSISGNFEKVNVDSYGNINASYSNGKSYNIAKLAISKFTNPQGLLKAGKTMFKITANTDNSSVIADKSYIGVAGESGRGSIMPSHLEMSNADLSSEFTDLIVYQRSFDASSKGVTTADEMLQTAIQLKR